MFSSFKAKNYIRNLFFPNLPCIKKHLFDPDYSFPQAQLTFGIYAQECIVSLNDMF